MTSPDLDPSIAPRTASRRRRVRIGASIAGLCLALGVAVTPANAAAPDAASITAAENSDPTSTPPTVLVGIAGLRWTDVNRTTTPTLWGMIGTGSVASMGGRISCSRDAWTTLSAGRELSTDDLLDDAEPDEETPGDAAPDEKTPNDLDFGCLPMPRIDTELSGVGPADIADWAIPETESPDALPGSLGTALAEAGTCTTAVGPGAAIMLADSTGHVDRYAENLGDLSANDLTKCGVVAVDAGALPDGVADRKKMRQDLDRELAQLREKLPAGSRIILSGLMNTAPTRPELQVVVDWQAPGGSSHWLTSESTRRQGVVQLVDLAEALAQAGQADTKGMSGEPLVVGELRRMGVAQTVGTLSYLRVFSETVKTLMPIVIATLGLTLLIGLGGALLSRRSALRQGKSPELSARGRRLLTAVLLLAASAPGAASVAALSRWWIRPAPIPVLSISLVVAAAGLAVAAWWISRALPRSPLALAGAISGLTWVVLTVDGLTGTILQQGSILGSSPEMAARFYGFNNTTFAVYATAALIFAGAVAVLLPRGRIIAIVVIGIVTTVVNGWPSFGADFGGVFALVPAFAVLGMLALRIRVTPRRIAVVAGGTILVVGLVAIVDWLAPGAPSHVGLFVQQTIDGQGLTVIARKAAGAWATIANPAGALALLAALAAGFAVLQPRRCKLPMVADAYEAVPLLRPITVSLVVAAFVGSALNDSGIIIAVMFLIVGTAMLACSFLAVPGGTEPPSPTSTPSSVAPTTSTRTHAMTPALIATAGGLLIVLLLASSVLTSAVLRPAATTATAGEESRISSNDGLSDGTGIIVVGTTGINWADVDAGKTPTLSALLADGAAAGGVSQLTGVASRCTVGGWLSLSAGQLTTTATERTLDGYWDCPTPAPLPDTADGTGVTIEGWAELVELQKKSTYQAVPGTLGKQLTEAPCATAVGPGAALALAGPEGTVARYRTLDEALRPESDAFDCPVTLVDAGDATAPRLSSDLPAKERSTLRTELRNARLASVDATVSAVLDAAPSGTPVVVVDVAGAPGARYSLGIALARPGAGSPEQARYLTSAATHSDGIARTLDIPANLLDAAGIEPTDPIQNTPLIFGSPRPSEAAATASALAEVTARDFVRRDAYVYFIDFPFYAGVALAVLCLIAGRLRTPATRWRTRLTTWARGAALFLAAVPASAFLVSLTEWWRFDRPGVALAVSAVVMSATVAGLAALAPRKPVWLAPGVIAGITYLVLTIDGVIGTPFNRTSPLGAVPTFGARFYGFGNPTFSIYVVAGLLFAAALAQWLILKKRRGWALAVVTVIGALSMIMVVWPTFGADLGGGLVLVPGFAVLGISTFGARVTWRRVLLVGAAGVAAAAAVGVLDWLRPAQDRSHLGRFTGQVIDGEAFSTLLRKAGYALRTVLDGFPVWLTILVLVLSAFILFGPHRFIPGWWKRAEGAWPLLRPATLGLWIVLVAGSLVNDFGVKIAMIALISAVPLYTIIGLSVSGEPSVSAEPEGNGPGLNSGAGPEVGSDGDPGTDVDSGAEVVAPGTR